MMLFLTNERYVGFPTGRKSCSAWTNSTGWLSSSSPSSSELTSTNGLRIVGCLPAWKCDPDEDDEARLEMDPDEDDCEYDGEAALGFG